MSSNDVTFTSFANIFLPIYELPFCFVYCFLCCAKALSISSFHLFTFVFISIPGDRLQKNIASVYVRECLFSSRSFIVSGLTLQSLIHFELIFVFGVKE